MTLSEIELASFRFIALRLNQLPRRVPPSLSSSEVENEWKYNFTSHTPPAHAHGKITFVCTTIFNFFVRLF